nr:MAG TPA_asm: hypothetical protein [Caudoviricetes sp.]
MCQYRKWDFAKSRKKFLKIGGKKINVKAY